MKNFLKKAFMVFVCSQSIPMNASEDPKEIVDLTVDTEEKLNNALLRKLFETRFYGSRFYGSRVAWPQCLTVRGASLDFTKTGDWETPSWDDIRDDIANAGIYVWDQSPEQIVERKKYALDWVGRSYWVGGGVIAKYVLRAVHLANPVGTFTQDRAPRGAFSFSKESPFENLRMALLPSEVIVPFRKEVEFKFSELDYSRTMESPHRRITEVKVGERIYNYKDVIE